MTERNDGTRSGEDLSTICCALMVAEEGSDLFITAGLSAGHQDRRQDDAGVNQNLTASTPLELARR